MLAGIQAGAAAPKAGSICSLRVSLPHPPGCGPGTVRALGAGMGLPPPRMCVCSPASFHLWVHSVGALLSVQGLDQLCLPRGERWAASTAHHLLIPAWRLLA